jgi:hypothetical protein
VPQLELYPVPLYNPLHPNHWEYDNLPLQSLIDRDEAINGELENNSSILRDAIGTQGTLANRLNQSINEDGSLKATAIDEALHNIAEHEDGSKELTSDEIDDIEVLGYVVSNPVPYVRMLEAERDKLALIASEATNLSIEVETPSNVVLFEDGVVTFAPSDSVTWQISSGKIKANLGFPLEAAHRHYYDMEPVTSDYIEFTVNSISTAFIEGSLRVYINGVRLSSEVDIYVPGNLVSDSWVLISFTPSPEDGSFTLSTEITEDDIIRIDFDVALT